MTSAVDGGKKSKVAIKAIKSGLRCCVGLIKGGNFVGWGKNRLAGENFHMNNN